MAIDTDRATVERLRAMFQSESIEDLARALYELASEDFVQDWPQSGERIRGRENFRAILEHYPGGLEGAEADASMDRVLGGEDHWIVAPTFTMVRVSGAEDIHTAILKLRYGGGEEWIMIGLFELKDGMIYRATSFFAPTFESPEWRRQWVERIE